MGWIPSEYHKGIEGILESCQLPNFRCMNYFDESLGRRITGMKHREKVMKELDVQEVGDRHHGGRVAHGEWSPKGTLTFYNNKDKAKESKRTKE